MLEFGQLAGVVQRNCDISDARHAGDFGLCTFLLKMREFYRWEHEVPFGGSLPADELSDWLSAREALWSRIEADAFSPLRLEGGQAGPFDTDAVNRELLPRGYVYSAGYGLLRKPLFFLGRLQRVEERAGFTILVSSCEYARELAAAPAMLQGRTIFLRHECVRRYLWEKFDEWRWRKLDNAMGRALMSYPFMADAELALERMARDEAETMISHEIGEARAGELLGEAWHEMLGFLARTRAESVARAVRDLLADCLSTLPDLLQRAHLPGLHFYFATFEGMRRQLFPQAMLAYRSFLPHGDLRPLAEIVHEGKGRWLALARDMLSQYQSDAAACRATIEALPERAVP